MTRAHERHQRRDPTMPPPDVELPNLGSWERDVATGMMHWSPDAKEIFGLEAEGASPTYQTLMKFVHVDDRARLRQLQESALSSGKMFSAEYRIVRKSGEVRHVREIGDFEKDERSTVFHGAIQDITESKQTADRSTAQMLQLQALFDSSLDAMLIQDSDGRYIDLNAAACELFGAPKVELIGLTPKSSVEGHSDLKSIWAAFLQAGHYRGRRTVVRKDGSRRTVDISATANVLPDRHLSILRDVTDQEKLEAQSLQDQKMEAVGLLGGGIAHDFNNLLNVIVGFTELLQTGLEDGSVPYRHTSQVLKAARQAGDLTKQLLAFSRKQMLIPRVLDVNAVILEFVATLPRLVDERIAVTLSLAPDLGSIEVDPLQLVQVLTNLMSNARDAMPNGGSLAIKTESFDGTETRGDVDDGSAPGKYVVVSVTDSGLGMSREVRSHIFEPFFTTKEPGKGPGLGLSTVYGFVKQSGGYVRVESEPGLGTTVHVYLPVVWGQPSGERLHPEVERAAVGNETILFVEDVEQLRQLGKTYLEGAGYRVLTASDGTSALGLAKEVRGTIELLVTDVVMPRMSGRELARQLCAERSEVSVIFVSGYADSAIVRQGLLDPGFHFLHKPYSLDDLGRKIRDVLDDSRPDPLMKPTS
jgi:two-component system, cell cycle sensor histidine kinase and response regulator CckA